MAVLPYEQYLHRFHREAQTAARFSSPNIVQAIDVGSAGDVHYFVMEYVEGLSIKDALDRKAKFTPQESLGIILRIGTWELLYNDDVPDGVAVSEAVALAKTLSTDESPSFINGLLGRLQQLKPSLLA